MELPVRTITEDEVPAWCGALNTGFLNPAGPIDAEARRPGLFLDRTWAGFDGNRIVSTLRTFPSELTVPGGARLRASAVTAVTTTSTHRRRGLARRMVNGELAATAERGEQVSILISSEWPIYGRYGYGASTEHPEWTVDATSGRLRERPQGTVEYVDRDTARVIAAEVYDRHRRNRPGEMLRPDRFWDIDFGILRYPSWPEPKPSFHVVARRADGSPVGVARYDYEERYEGRMAAGQANVALFVTDDPAGDALLWEHLISLDRVPTVRAGDRPVDDLLPWLLADARHARASDRLDFLWVRPVDVAAMLSARSYLVPGRIVLDVADSSGLAGGRYALDADVDGANCVRTTESADLSLSVAALGSVYLGGHLLRTLAAAGLVDEHSAGAVAKADAMFRSPITPWCSTSF
jgi:predicted acetyltransferase